MIEPTKEQLAAYVKQAFGASAQLTGLGEIGSLDEQGMKDFGYGKPLLITYELDGETREAVLSLMRGDDYGHQYYWDRAAILMFQYETGGLMEKHVKPLALGYVDAQNRLVPVNKPQEFFLVSEKVEGHDYFVDLDRIQKGDFREEDVTQARELARFLARVHANKKDDVSLYYRRIRNLVGSSECIMGLVDQAYPHPYPDFDEARFAVLEKRVVDWRWKLRKQAGRLAEVHGDFHPWNVLVRGAGDFSVLDRSRGQYGEPADDLATMAINYLLFGLYDTPRLEGPFLEIYLAYMDAYLEATGDTEILSLMAPFFVFRGLVVASPMWYPGHPDAVRQGLFRFMENVLEDEVFDYKNINSYME